MLCMQVPLTPVLNVLPLPHDTHQILTLARVLDALRRTLRDLGDYYSARAQPAAATASVSAAAAGQPVFPHVRHEHGECFLPYPLREEGRFSECVPLPGGSAVYRAMDGTTGRRVVIKCVFQPYGEDVHRTWAAAGVAPPMLDLINYPGGMQVVVMEECAPEEGWARLADLNGAEAEAGCCAAQQALQRVHQQASGVHGDVRVINTLFNPQAAAAGHCAVRFIDFEVGGAHCSRQGWVGQVGGGGWKDVGWLPLAQPGPCLVHVGFFRRCLNWYPLPDHHAHYVLSAMIWLFCSAPARTAPHATHPS